MTTYDRQTYKDRVMKAISQIEGEEMTEFRIDTRMITDEWFDNDHPNPLHPIGVIIDPIKRCVEVPTPGGIRVGGVGDFIIISPEGTKYLYKRGGKND